MIFVTGDILLIAAAFPYELLMSLLAFLIIYTDYLLCTGYRLIASHPDLKNIRNFQRILI